MNVQVPGDASIGALVEVYGQTVTPEEAALTVAGYFARRAGIHVSKGDILPLGLLKLVANQVTDGQVVTAGLQLDEPETPQIVLARPTSIMRMWRRILGPARRRRRRQRPPQ